jgi:di/tricarboxylate transporter
MTLQQGLAFALILGAVVCFAWGRFRYDVVALCVLLAGLLIGVIPFKDAFDGFRNDIVVIIATALIVSRAVERSGVVEAAMTPVLLRLKHEHWQVPVLVLATTCLSMVTKNIGALAIFMPLAMQLSRTTQTSASRLLMPMSFGALLGGCVTLVGTSPNIIVSEVRQETLGRPFEMFDFTPVGLGLAIIGVIFLSFAYRVLPKNRQGAASIDAALGASAYVTEAKAPAEGWLWDGHTVTELMALGGSDVSLAALVRDGKRTASPRGNVKLRSGDILLLEGEQQALDQLMVKAGLKLEREDKPVPKDEPQDEVIAAEAVVTKDSRLVGKSARSLGLNDKFGINLLAVSRRGARIEREIKAVPLRPGDAVVLQGSERILPGALSDLKLLPLAQRELKLGGAKPGFLPVLILAGVMVLVAFKVIPIAVAFFAAAVAVILIGAVPMRDAYASLDGPVLVLIAALIPVSEAVRSTGGTELIAGYLSNVLNLVPPIGAIAIFLVAAMISAPFLHNAPTVLVLGPIAVSLAQRLHLGPDPFLMAVAVGAGCDFLTPIGHQCNTLVMGPGGYRFSDYARLGALLSICVVIAGVILISVFWPLARH